VEACEAQTLTAKLGRNSKMQNVESKVDCTGLLDALALPWQASCWTCNMTWRL